MLSKNTLGAAFGYTAGLLNLVGFIWYCSSIFMDNTMTNPITWWLWFAETAISLAIYADRTRDVSKWFAEAVSMAGVSIVSLYLLWRAVTGDTSIVFAEVEHIDYVAFIFAASAFGIWLKTRKKYGASMALWFFQFALISAVFPLLRSTYENPLSEPLWPWAIWTVVFALQTACAWLRWDGFEPVVSPINYTLTHGLVVIAIILGTASN